MRAMFLVFVSFAFVLSGCGNQPNPPVSAAPVKPVVALVVKTLTNPFFVDMEKGARRAEKELGFTLKVKSAAQETSIDQQIAIIDALISDAVTALVVAPGSSTELIPVLKKAQDKGIILVNIDNQLDAKASAAAGLKPVPFISVDNVKGGYLSAKALTAGVKAPAEAAILEGIREAANANQRKQGAEKAFAENPAVRLVDSRSADWKIDEAYDVTKAIFMDHPNVKLLFAANDMMALGAIQYLSDSHRSGVKVAGFDNLDDARKAILAGHLVATVDQQADEQGYAGCVTAIKLLHGETVPALVEAPVRLVTKDHMDQ